MAPFHGASQALAGGDGFDTNSDFWSAAAELESNSDFWSAAADLDLKSTLLEQKI